MPQYAPFGWPRVYSSTRMRLRRPRDWFVAMSRARSTWLCHAVSGSSSSPNGAPASLVRTVSYRFHTVSSPRLSYAPPSVRSSRSRYAT